MPLKKKTLRCKKNIKKQTAWCKILFSFFNLLSRSLCLTYLLWKGILGNQIIVELYKIDPRPSFYRFSCPTLDLLFLPNNDNKHPDGESWKQKLPGHSIWIRSGTCFRPRAHVPGGLPLSAPSSYLSSEPLLAKLPNKGSLAFHMKVTWKNALPSPLGSGWFSPRPPAHNWPAPCCSMSSSNCCFLTCIQIS